MERLMGLGQAWINTEPTGDVFSQLKENRLPGPRNDRFLVCGQDGVYIYTHMQLCCILSGNAVPGSGSAELRKNGRIRQEYIMLKEQYRMHPEISRFPSKRFYGGRLIDVSTKPTDGQRVREPRRMC